MYSKEVVKNLFKKMHGMSGFVVNLDDIWNVFGWSTKHAAKDSLKRNSTENVDYQITKKHENTGRPTFEVMLTVQCFKDMAMKSPHKDNGRAVRDYYIDLESRVLQGDIELASEIVANFDAVNDTRSSVLVTSVQNSPNQDLVMDEITSNNVSEESMPLVMKMFSSSNPSELPIFSSSNPSETMATTSAVAIEPVTERTQTRTRVMYRGASGARLTRFKIQTLKMQIENLVQMKQYMQSIGPLQPTEREELILHGHRAFRIIDPYVSVLHDDVDVDLNE